MQTERIGFSRWTEDDIGFAETLWGNADVCRYICAKGKFSNDEIKARLALEIENNDTYDVQYWPIFELKTGSFIGCCGLRPYENAFYEFGIHLQKTFWGKGFALEASKAVIDYCFNHLESDKLFAGHHPDNIASKIILEKLGFRLQKTVYYEPTKRDHPLYVLSESTDH